MAELSQGCSRSVIHSMAQARITFLKCKTKKLLIPKTHPFKSFGWVIWPSILCVNNLFMFTQMDHTIYIYCLARNIFPPDLTVIWLFVIFALISHDFPLHSSPVTWASLLFFHYARLVPIFRPLTWLFPLSWRFFHRFPYGWSPHFIEIFVLMTPLQRALSEHPTQRKTTHYFLAPDSTPSSPPTAFLNTSDIL